MKSTHPARKRSKPRPPKRACSILNQIFKWIPAGLPDRLAREAQLDIRGFSCTSHVASLLYGQIAHASSLNEICDAAGMHEPEWERIRGATAPKRNTFSNANRTRDPEVAERLYWEVFEHLQQVCPGFTQHKKHKGFIFRLKREIFAIDSTTLQLAMNCVDWARHRRKKAAAKTHMRINVGSMLPAFAVVEDAAHHDSTRADALCEGLCDGDVLLADRAYVDLAFLHALTQRGVFFVLREKKNMVFEVQEDCIPGHPRILRDQRVVASLKGSAQKYPVPLRRVTAIVEVDGKDMEMTFLTNHMDWSGRTIAELYRARWAIELFFKELKQTLQLADFVGYNEKAVKWQVWIGLLAHLLLRFLKHASGWALSFSRLAGMVRNGVWMKADVVGLLRIYGTADGPKRPVPASCQMHFQGFEAFTGLPMG